MRKGIRITRLVSLLLVLMIAISASPALALYASGDSGQAEKEDPWATLKLPGYENTVRGVTGPDGQVISGYTWEMYRANLLEKIKKEGIRVKIDQNQIKFPDQKPVMIDGRVLVPMRPVFESEWVQCRVYWNEEVGEATVMDQRGRKIVFKPGEYSYRVIHPDGAVEEKPLDVPAMIIDGRVLLPTRALFGQIVFKVEWDEFEQCVYAKSIWTRWRKMLPRDEWLKSLEEECAPCLMGVAGK